MKLPCTILASILPALCAMAVPRYWEADVRSPAAFQTAAYRGETVQLTARLADRGAPFEVPAGATARMLVSTNDFRDGCWEWPATVSTSGLVRATWTPDMDPGGPAVRIFLAVSESGTNVNYGANCTMRLLGSPGATPNALPLPAATIDFAAVRALNAPWLVAETDPTVPEWAKATFPPEIPPETDPVFAAASNRFLVAESDPTVPAWAKAAEPPAIPPESDPVFGEWRDQAALPSIGLTDTEFPTGGIVPGRPFVTWTYRFWRDYIHGHRYENGVEVDDWIVNYPGADGTLALSSDVAAAAQAATNYTDAAVAAIDIPDPDLSFTNGYARLADLGSAAYADADDYATPSDVATEVAAASNALGRAWSADAALLSMLLQGSNVVAEVTNYNSQVRSPSLRLLQLNASNEYDVVWSELTNLSKVAQDASDHADAVAAAALNTSTNYAAPRAWSGTTSGLGAEAPAGWTWISTPNLAIGGGLEFEKHATSGGAVWVLRNNGMVAQMNALTNNTAYLEISSLDGESVFRIEKTDAQTLGVNTASVSVDGSTLICGVDVVSASPPLVRLKTSLSQGEWVREEDGIPPSLADVQWEGESGAWVCRITNNSGGHSLFATMAVIQEGGTKIVPAAPMDAGAGILCTDGVHKVRPVYSNGAITWEVFQ